jgi:hypothetical protein
MRSRVPGLSAETAIAMLGVAASAASATSAILPPVNES